MHILVTGGCGYIGSALLPILRDADDVEHVTVLDDFSMSSPRNLLESGLGWDETLSFRRGDVTEYGDIESAVRGCDTIIHLAAITGAASTHDRREETFRVNYGGTENVLRAAGKFDVENVVFASSCNLYGRAATEDIDEETEPDPLNPYAESKYEAESLLADSQAEYGFDGTALRMSTNYGYAPGVRFNLVVNHFVFRALTDRPLTVYGDGSNWRPFIHVQDAARAYAHAALHPAQWPEHVYNVGHSDGNYRVSEIAEAVQSELNRDLDITYLEDKHPGPSYHVNFDRLDATGFTPEYTVREGIRDLATKFQQES
ncbi:NAD(P)-dependent oxidoreductase [Halobellus sp. Atlit-38R]|uniref:NAD-dependent epimerase/dehydratase family protein n=1 Tax=Halobellus sp. Atlit-38R TaxID=2282131 RepID=UPI000EF1BC04|nr:NAD(P)-dependent oxidoreductase [Halobellus sp. Atlit-38R]RLM83749.1 NAD(P)-dependent oxidoreductase [Halobellus sp. Atlit-38R]